MAASRLRSLIPSRIRRHPIAQWLRDAGSFPRLLPIFLAGQYSGHDVRVFYGHPHIPERHERTYGGIVKFQGIQGVFPNSPRRFNILYMVSSRMPAGASSLTWLARKMGARVVWNQDGVAYPAWHGPGWEALNSPMARLLHAADYVFYQSWFAKRSADRYLGERKEAWEILYNPVDTHLFTPAESDPDPNQLVLILAGTHLRYYRIASALETLAWVAKRRPDVHLLIAGRLTWISDETRALKITYRLAVDLGVEHRLTFLGAYSQADAPSIFRRAHMLLHTQYNDPCPSVVLEAMACGLPVVYSHSGGVPELVGPDAGIGVPAELSWDREIPPDPQAMAQAVLETADRRKEFAEAARQRAVDRFDVRPWIRRHREIFHRLLQ